VALLADSTNIDRRGFTGSETEVVEAFEEIFTSATARIVVAAFASSIYRMQILVDLAAQFDRKVAFVGRGMIENSQIAQRLGYLRIPAGVQIRDSDVASHPAQDVLCLTTGSQGEPLSALSRIAQRNHHLVHIEEGDTVILASSLIPGNENAVYRVINGLSRWGANVVHKGNALVHVSGHASAGELLYCYNIVQPSNVMPIHGEIRHLRANAELARRTGVPADQVVLAEDGVVVDLVEGKAKIVGKVACGYVFVDGSSVGDITESSLKDRRILGEEGFISVVVVVDSVTGKVSGGPEIHARGFVENDSTFDEIKPALIQALDAAAREGVDSYQLQQTIRRVVGRWVNNKHRRRPMIIPVVVEA
jgi:ribonuclease J